MSIRKWKGANTCTTQAIITKTTRFIEPMMGKMKDEMNGTTITECVYSEVAGVTNQHPKNISWHEGMALFVTVRRGKIWIII